MKFPGFAVTNQSDGRVTIQSIVLDETELTPESDWMEGYPNRDPELGVWVGRDIEAALKEIRNRLLR